MTYDRLDPIILAVCHAYDYDKDSGIKLSEIKELLFPLGNQMNDKTALISLYGIITVSLEMIKEIECLDVTSVDEMVLNQKVD